MKKLISVLLAVAVLLCICPRDYQIGATEVQPQAETDMESIIREQIEAFAKSIDQKNADDTAAKALAKHGISGGGKTLSVGKNHALTATLMNSELMKLALTDACRQTVEYMQTLDEKVLYLDVGGGWNTTRYYYSISRDPKMLETEYLVKLKHGKDVSANAYDNSLVWMAGSIGADMEIKERAVGADTITYDVKVRIWDRFDFSTGSGSGFKDFISGMGALFFREFDWDSAVSFQIKVPNRCDHSIKSYHWTFDSDRWTLDTDITDEFTENEAIPQIYTHLNGTFRYHYQLEKTVNLMHDKPWVLEMKTVNPKNILLNALGNKYDCYPGLMLHGRLNFCARRYQILDMNDTDFLAHTDCYGTALRPNFSFVNGYPYTLVLENEIAEDGSNMLYLTVYNSAGGISLKRTPLDDYYFSDTEGVYHRLMDSEDSSVSGMDFRINYIGSSTSDYYGNSFRFYADAFDLKIWENGKNGENGDFWTQKVTKPTCTAKGYTTYTCTLCGCSYKADYTAKLSHKYDGETDGDCNLCGEIRFLRGDMNGDGVLGSSDAVYLLRYSIMPNLYPLSQAADVNGDGTVNSADAVYLLRHTIMPQAYPLK